MSELRVASPDLSEIEVDEILLNDRLNSQALLSKADHRAIKNDLKAATAYYRAAVSTGMLNRSDETRATAIIKTIQDKFSDHIVTYLEAQGHTAAQWHPRFRKSLALMFGQIARDNPLEKFPQLPNLYFYPDLQHYEFADFKDADWVECIVKNYEKLYHEAEQVLAQSASFNAYVKPSTDRPQGDVHGMLDNKKWSTFDLIENGLANAECVKKCPETYSIISENADLCDIQNRAPSIMFSLLKAGANIPPHTGMLNTRFICHLPLIVPGNGALRVGSTIREWEKAKLLVFDDTVEHEAWNNSSEDRLVVIFDIWRPELDLIERDQIRCLFSAVDAY